jgi:hypothetical protein
MKGSQRRLLFSLFLSLCSATRPIVEVPMRASVLVYVSVQMSVGELRGTRSARAAVLSRSATRADLLSRACLACHTSEHHFFDLLSLFFFCVFSLRIVHHSDLLLAWLRRSSPFSLFPVRKTKNKSTHGRNKQSTHPYIHTYLLFFFFSPYGTCKCCGFPSVGGVRRPPRLCRRLRRRHQQPLGKRRCRISTAGILPWLHGRGSKSTKRTLRKVSRMTHDTCASPLTPAAATGTSTNSPSSL